LAPAFFFRRIEMLNTPRYHEFSLALSGKPFLSRIECMKLLFLQKRVQIIFFFSLDPFMQEIFSPFPSPAESNEIFPFS